METGGIIRVDAGVGGISEPRPVWWKIALVWKGGGPCSDEYAKRDETERAPSKSQTNGEISSWHVFHQNNLSDCTLKREIVHPV